MTPREERDALKASKSIDAGTREGFAKMRPRQCKCRQKPFSHTSLQGSIKSTAMKGTSRNIQLQTGGRYPLHRRRRHNPLDRGPGAGPGTGDARQWHVYVKPMKSNIATNFMIATDKRSYPDQGLVQETSTIPL